MVEFILWLVDYAEKEHVEFVISMSSDKAKCPEELKPYLI